jgi:hypothetical protein
VPLTRRHARSCCAPPRVQHAAPATVAAGAVPANDLAASYSFADLGSSRAAAAAGDGGAGVGVDASSASAVFMARLQAGPSALGMFGSLLGDKAAEMTAMAQQKLESSFGDFLPTSALGSAGGLLSTFAKNVVKK